MRRVSLIVALNLLAVAFYALVALRMGFFSHMSATLFSSPDSHSYRDVADWLVGGAANPFQSRHRPFLYPLLLGVADGIGGAVGVWALNALLWFGVLNATALATWRMTGRIVLAAIVFLIVATNVSLIVLSFQALTELTTAFLEAAWILGLAISSIPPNRPREIVLVLLPLSLLTVVKPGYQVLLLGGLVLLAPTIWRMRRGRLGPIIAVAACCLPIAFQVALMATANHFIGLSSTGAYEIKDYYVSQVYAIANGLPSDLTAARSQVDGMSNAQVADFLLAHPGLAAHTLVSNLHQNLVSGSNFIDVATNPTLAAAVQLTNRAYLVLHLIFLPIVALAVWRSRDVRLVLLYVFTVVVIILPTVIVTQGDRYSVMALPLWATAYALALARVWPSFPVPFRSRGRYRAPEQTAG